MAFRFRKSMKIAPGLKVNLTQKGLSARVGPKGAGYTVNSKGDHTANVGIPGSGISYSKKVKSGKKIADSSASSAIEYESGERPSTAGKKAVAVLLVLICIVFLISVIG